jgi:hypothetical protein
MYFWNWRILSISLYILMLVIPASAQLPLSPAPVYAHYHSYNSSLPAELIYKIHADRNGYLWLATDRGLVRYNGREFLLVTTGPAEDFVSSCLTGDNQLWLSSYSGHTAGIDFNTQKKIATDSLYGLNRITPNGRPFLVGIRKDNLLSLYGGQNKNQVIRIRLDTRKSWTELKDINETAQEILNRYEFSAGWQQQLKPELTKIINSNYLGLSVKDSFVTIGSRIFRIIPGREPSLYFNGAAYGIRASVMGFARRGNDLYLGGLHEIGLCRIKDYFSETSKKKVAEYLLPGESVTSVEKDYLGNIWVASHGNGLFFFPYAENDVLHYNKSNSGLYSDMVSYIGRFPGDITVMGYDNAITDFYGSGAQVPQRYVLPADNDMREVGHVEKTASSWLVFTRKKAYFAGLQKNNLPDYFRPVVLTEPSMDPGYKSGGQLRNIFYYISSNTVVALDTLGILSRHAVARFKSPKRTCLLPLTDSDFYIGTVRGGYRNGKALPYLQDEQVNAIDTVGGQLLWATNTGVYTIPMYSEDPHRLKQLSAVPCTALKHDDAFTYLRYGDELIVLESRSLRPVARFSSLDYPQPFRLNDFYPDKDYLILAGNQGLFYIPKQSLMLKAMQAPPMMHILCSLNNYAPADSVYTCVYRKGLAALFELDILDYRKEKKSIYCHILKDGEELYGERELKDDGTIDLHPTGPGRYQVVYRIKSGYTGSMRILTYVLVVKPLWYQQWWCLPALILFAGLFLVVVLYYILNRRTKLQRQKLEQKIYLHELEAKSLLGQLKPHFIFNVLTPFQGYLMRGEKQEGLDYLDHFSGLMRGMLQGIRHRYTPLSAEIAFIEQYLQVQQKRFMNCFVYMIHTDPALNPDACYIPSLLLQPLVENAVEHGIVKNGNDGHVDIILKALGDTVSITITDNGRGLPPDWKIKPDHALTIIMERVQLLKKTKGTGSFQIANNKDRKGVTAILILAKDNRI